MLLGLEMKDILYLSAKTTGSYDDGVYVKNPYGWDIKGVRTDTCVYVVPSFISPGMKEWLNSSRWKQQIEGDSLLYQAAHASLDRTVDRLGREEVARQVTEFRRANKMANDNCLPNTTFPCSAGGVRAPKRQDTSCLWFDSGCGYECFDHLSLR
jgi:hypothetical protein